MTSDASPPRDKEDRERSRLERIVPEVVRKLVDVGVEKLSDGPENLKQILTDLKLPKEAIGILSSQIDESKREITQILAREIREFLEKASIADELTRLLSGLTLEVKTQVRFVPNEDGHLKAKTEVRTKLGVQGDLPSSAESAHVNPTSKRSVGTSGDKSKSPEPQANVSATQSSIDPAELEKTQ